MTVTDTLVENNARYAAGFVPSKSAPRVAVVTCMDARLDVFALLGLRPGEAHVLRNAGGLVSDDVIRSLAISQRLLGTTEIMVVHHSECGMLTFTDADFAESLHRDTGTRPTWTAGAFNDLDADVRACIARIHESPFLPHKQAVRGFVVDVATGLLRGVD